MSHHHITRAREIVQQVLYVTVATVTDEGEPWNSPVYFSFDNDGKFYWVSSPDAQHSRNVEANGRAFIVVYDSSVPEGTGEGVYVEASVTALTRAADIAEARRHTCMRVGKPLEADVEQFLGAGARRAYRATPERVWINDDEVDETGNFVCDIRTEVPVETLHGLVTW